MNSKTAFIFHGTGGCPEENWFPWLKGELENSGYTTYIPDFGSDEFPNINIWKEELSKYVPYITEDSLVIGHSLGGAFLLKFLEGYKGKIHLLATIGSPIGIKPIKFYEGDSKFLDGFNFNWSKIRKKYNFGIIYHSNNDPYVSLGNGQELAKSLGVTLNYIENAGHFNKDSGYLKFPVLLAEIKKYI